MQSPTPGYNSMYSTEPPTHDELIELSGVALLEFGAPHCQHCLAAAPFVEQSLTQHPMPHIKVQDGKGQRLGRQFKVKLWPTIIVLNNGIELARCVRPTTQDELTELLSHRPAD
ncbi:MAG: thioredoxin family protein [Pseudomonadota bacterium]